VAWRRSTSRNSRQRRFEKIVVVKRLLPELVASPAYVEMFLAEGKLVARLDHPNICEVHELGRDGAEYYLAMPYLDGVPVHDLIARPRDPDRSAQLRVAAAVVAQACEGLHHAHELHIDATPANLVHRDVSPSNLFVTAGGVVKVLDFGIAKVRGAAATEVGTIKGKQQYMAPEQILGEPLDRRCDIFALGIVLFELATHQRLFKRGSDYLAARAILEEPIPRADASDPAVPSALADVIERALARDPAKRFATARELGAAVAAAITPASTAEIATMVTATDELSAQRTQARVLGEARSRGSVVTTPFADPTTITPRPARRRPWIYAALAIAAVVAIALIVFARSSEPAEHPPAPGDGFGGPAKPRAPAHDVAAPAADPPPIPAKPRDPARDVAPPEIPADPPIPAIDPPRATRQAPGLLSIDSTPYATIFVDGVRLGVTPIVKRSLPAGRRALRAELADGRSKSLAIDIPAGKAAAPIQLTW
jgi:serine/threonine-protein kinase